ncbi:MAG: flavodoxin [Butyrivibrio sp.]|jgi:flavodoxin|nr:flavodoxin [Butyrivibrio sp.]
MKTAIVYYSKHHGNTKKVIDSIVENHEVELINVTDPNACKDLSEYDRIGIASGIYYSSFGRPLLKYIRENLPKGKQIFLIYTCGSKKHSRKYTQEVRQIVLEKGSGIFGSYGCYGHDSFGPLKLVGGIRKQHPDDRELSAAVKFYDGLMKNAKK